MNGINQSVKRSAPLFETPAEASRREGEQLTRDHEEMMRDVRAAYAADDAEADRYYSQYP